MRKMIADADYVVGDYVSSAHLLNERPMPLEVADDYARLLAVFCGEFCRYQGIPEHLGSAADLSEMAVS